jgi:hypothetical protein
MTTAAATLPTATTAAAPIAVRQVTSLLGLDFASQWAALLRPATMLTVPPLADSTPYPA